MPVSRAPLIHLLMIIAPMEVAHWLSCRVEIKLGNDIKSLDSSAMCLISVTCSWGRSGGWSGGQWERLLWDFWLGSPGRCFLVNRFEMPFWKILFDKSLLVAHRSRPGFNSKRRAQRVAKSDRSLYHRGPIARLIAIFFTAEFRHLCPRAHRLSLFTFTSRRRFGNC